MHPSVLEARQRDLRATDLPLLRQSLVAAIGTWAPRLNADVPIHLYDTRPVPLEERGIATISDRAHARTRVHTASRSALMTGDGCASAA